MTYYNIRLGERIIANRKSCSFVPESAHEVAMVVKGIPHAHRYAADGVMNALHQKMVEDLSMMTVKNLPSVNLKHDTYWIEFMGEKRDNAVLASRSAVYLKKIKPEEIAENSPAHTLINDDLAYILSGHVVIETQVPTFDPAVSMRGFVFDPFRVLIPVKKDGTVNDFAVEMLVEDQSTVRLVEAVMQSSSRIVAMAVYTMTMVANGRFKLKEITPDQKYADSMLRSNGDPAALMPHHVVITKGWRAADLAIV